MIIPVTLGETDYESRWEILSIEKKKNFFPSKFECSTNLVPFFIISQQRAVGLLLGCGWGAKNEDEFFSENPVNFFEKPTSYWNLKKN